MNYYFKCETIKSNDDISDYYSNLERIKKYSVFYSYSYINNNNNGKLIYFLLFKNDDLIALMPIHLNEIKSSKVSSGYYDAVSPYGYNGPLFINEVNDIDIVEFWNQVDKWYYQNNIVTEFVRFSLNNNHKNYTGNLLPTLNNVRGELCNFDNLWSSFKPKVRNNYRKSIKYNLQIKVYHQNITLNVIDSFYDIYISSMLRNNASDVYFYSKNYFKNLIADNIKNIIIAIVYKDDISISAELIIIDDNVLYSHLGGTNSEYFNMRPNDFLKIEIMKWGLNNNKKVYNLGGGRNNDDSLYQYKKTYFSKDNDVIFYTGRKIINNKVYGDLLHEIDNKLDIKKSIQPEYYFPLYKQ